MSDILDTTALPDFQPVIIAVKMVDSVTGKQNVVPVNMIGNSTTGYGIGISQTPWTYLNLATVSATTTIATGSGVLHGIAINALAGSAYTIRFMDATVTIATVNCNSALGTVIYDVKYNTSLVAYTLGANAPNLTVLYA